MKWIKGTSRRNYVENIAELTNAANPINVTPNKENAY
jgi:hypothetical protein